MSRSSRSTWTVYGEAFSVSKTDGRFSGGRSDFLIPSQCLSGLRFPPRPKLRKSVRRCSSLAARRRRSGVLGGDQLHLRFIRTAKRNWFSLAVADGQRSLNYGSLLVESLLLARRLKKVMGRTSASERGKVGLLLPPSTEAALANLAVLFAGLDTPVNLAARRIAGPGSPGLSSAAAFVRSLVPGGWGSIREFRLKRRFSQKT